MLPSSGKYENTYSYDFERIKGIYEIARGLIIFFSILHIVVTYLLLLSTLNMVKLKLKKNKQDYVSKKVFFFSIKN